MAQGGLRPDALDRLAEGDAFAALGINRRDALWAARALRGPKPLPLFGVEGEGEIESNVALPLMTLGQEVIEDYVTLRLSLRAHPMELLRPRLVRSTPNDRLPHLNGASASRG